MSVLDQTGRIQALGFLAWWQLTSHALYYNLPYDQDLEYLKIEIGKIAQDPQKREEILKICCIYSSNRYLDGNSDGLGNGVRIKTSRFNHSCKPNAITIRMVNNLFHVRAISNIKLGSDESKPSWLEPGLELNNFQLDSARLVTFTIQLGNFH